MNGKLKHLGFFNTVEEANEAREQAQIAKELELNNKHLSEKYKIHDSVNKHCMRWQGLVNGVKKDISVAYGDKVTKEQAIEKLKDKINKLNDLKVKGY